MVDPSATPTSTPPMPYVLNYPYPRRPLPMSLLALAIIYEIFDL